MKHLFILLLSLLCFQRASAQETVKKYEFGSTLITVNSLDQQEYFGTDRPPLEFINGLFFRYNKKRTALRAQVSYSGYSSGQMRRLESFEGPLGWDKSSNDFRLGLGGQINLLKEQDWLYSCLDLSYRNVKTVGHDYGILSSSFTLKAVGADCFLGLGVKLTVFKCLVISPEAGFNASIKYINRSSGYIYGNYIEPQVPMGFVYREHNLIPVCKLRLSVKF